jgi:hypothetical protein
MPPRRGSNSALRVAWVRVEAKVDGGEVMEVLTNYVLLSDFDDVFHDLEKLILFLVVWVVVSYKVSQHQNSCHYPYCSDDVKMTQD